MSLRCKTCECLNPFPLLVISNEVIYVSSVLFLHLSSHILFVYWLRKKVAKWRLVRCNMQIVHTTV